MRGGGFRTASNHKSLVAARMSSVNLADLVSKSASRPAGPASKKARTEFLPLQFFQTLGENLLNIRKHARGMVVSRSLDVKEVEVEVRVGMLVFKRERRWKETMEHLTHPCVLSPSPELKTSLDLEFTSGVDEVYAEHLKHVLSEKGFVGTSEAVQRLRLDGSGKRWQINSAGLAVSQVESKVRFYRNDLALLSHEYDVRIDGASEREASKSMTEKEARQLEDSWTQERQKKRIAYRHKDHPAWKIDLTEVEVFIRHGGGKGGKSSGGGGETRLELELEFELESVALASWLEGEDATNEKTTKVASALMNVINLCIPYHLAPPSEPTMKTYTDDARAQVQRLTDLLKSGASTSLHENTSSKYTSAKGLEFVGSKPVNLLHKNIAMIRRKDYFATEKSDGTRYLLYVVEDSLAEGRPPVAVLMDQSRTLVKMRGGHEIGRALRVGTVLDGELVFNRSFKETVFLVFDVLMIDEVPELHHPFSVRVGKIEKDIMPRCAQYLSRSAEASGSSEASSSAAAAAAEKPTKIIRKVFYLKRDLGVLISKMHFEDGERIFMDSARRHHKSDGIIFQPDTPYRFSADIDLLKWKWPELQSVDLQAVPIKARDGETTHVTLSAAGPDYVLIDCTKRASTHVGMGRFDTFRLLADMQEEGQGKAGKAVIVECAYDTSIGMWRYLRLRKDKENPNHIDTVLGVFAEMAEAISIEELEYCLLQPAGSTSDFAQRLGKMKRQLLEWQRQQTQAASGGGGGGGERGKKGEHKSTNVFTVLYCELQRSTCVRLVLTR